MKAEGQHRNGSNGRKVVGPLEMRVCNRCGLPKPGWTFLTRTQKVNGKEVVKQEGICGNCRRKRGKIAHAKFRSSGGNVNL